MPKLMEKKSSGNAIQKIKLPERVKLSDHELSTVTRLIRAMRQPGSSVNEYYWIGPFIEWLLYLDAASPDLEFVSPGKAYEVLGKLGKEFSPKQSSDFIKSLVSDCPGILFASALRTKNANRNFLPNSEEDEFYEILRLWRMEYPEPPKKAAHPAGHLGRSDEDDDEARPKTSLRCTQSARDALDDRPACCDVCKKTIGDSARIRLISGVLHAVCGNC